MSLFGSFTDIEFPIFIALIIPTFMLVYWSYYQELPGVRNIGGGLKPNRNNAKARLLL